MTANHTIQKNTILKYFILNELIFLRKSDCYR